MALGLGPSAVDQAVASLGNFGTIVVVARLTTPESFGSFSLTIAIYAIWIAISQALISEVMLFEYPRQDDKLHCRLAPVLLGVAIGIFAGLTCLIVWLGGLGGEAIAISGLFMPALIVEDVLRYFFLSTGKSVDALIMDTLWLLLQALAFVLLFWKSSSVSVTVAIAAWGATSALAAAYGLVRMKPKVGPGEFAAFYRLTKPHAGYLLSDYGVTVLSVNLVPFALSASFGLVEAGALRAAMTIFNPLNVLVNALRLVLVPLWSTDRPTSSQTHIRRAILVSTCVIATCLAATAVVVAAPTAVGTSLFGPTWTLAMPLLGLAGLQRVLSAGSIGPIVVLRSMKRTREGMTAKVVGGTITLVAGLAGAWLGGAFWALIGLCVGGVASSLSYCVVVRAAALKAAQSRSTAV